MLPLDLWIRTAHYLENATEIGRLCVALNVPLSLFISSILPVQLRNDMIACTIKHNRKDVFSSVVRVTDPGLSTSFCEELWSTLSFALPQWQNEPRVSDWKEKMVKWSRTNGGCPWDELTIRNAAVRGRTDIVKWLRSQQCPWEEDDMCALAAVSNNLELFLWLLSQKCPCTAYAYVQARKAESHSVQEWMENEPVMGQYLKSHDYFNFSYIQSKLLEFSI